MRAARASGEGLSGGVEEIGELWVAVGAGDVRGGLASIVASAMAFVPIIDGDLLPVHPMAAITAGSSADIPLMTGVTADERPCKAVVDVVPIEDLHATIFRALGMSPKLAYEVEQRPFYITRDGLGKPIESLFA